MSARPARRSPARCPTSTSRCPPTCCRRSRSSSGSRRRRQRLCRPGAVALSRPAATRGSARPGYRGPDADHPVAWRRRADRRGRRGSRPARVLSGPAGGVAGSRPCGAAARRRQSDPVRHGRHQHRHLPRRRRRGGARHGPHASAATASRSTASTSSASAPAAARSRRVDAGGILHVGPESAGAVPGPACYGRGGTERDRDRRQPGARLSRPGEFPRRRAPARPRRGRGRAVDAHRRRARHRPAGGRARGIHRVVNTNMAEGVRLVSVRRGVDPRRFALLAFGGAAGLHVTDDGAPARSARGSSCRASPPVLSAWGMLATDLRFEVARTPCRRHRRARRRRASSALFAEMEARGPRPPARARFDGPVRGAPQRRHALWRAGLRDRRAARRCRLGRRRPAAADRRALPPPARGALHLCAAASRRRCWSTPASPFSACSKPCRASRRLPAAAPAAPRGERRIYLDDWVSGAGLRFRRAGPGAAHRRPGDRRSRR